MRDERGMIDVRHLTFEYQTPAGAIRVLDGIDLQVGRGEFVALMGVNGSGKTTLARCLNGLLLPTSGDVVVEGFTPARPDDLLEIRYRVGMVFQNPDEQIVSTVVEREVAFGLENLGSPVEVMRQRVDEILRAFHLERYRRSPTYALSGGEKQRLCIASVMAMRPSYLILDEPTSLLDPQARREVLALLGNLHRDGVTIILITQSPDEAVHADRVVVVQHGRIALDGPPEAVFGAADRLLSMGLDLPFPMRVVRALQGCGVRIEGTPIREDELAEALRRLRSVRNRSDPSQLDRPPEGDTSVLLPRRPAASSLQLRHRSEGGFFPAKLSLPDSLPRGSGAIIALEKVGYVYDDGLPTARCALSDVTTCIEAGTCTALIGPGGSGKTTLIQHLNGLLRPTYGRVVVAGQDLWKDRKTDLCSIRQKVGLVFQFPELQLFEETVARDVAFGPTNLGWSEGRITESVSQALSAVQLDPDRFGGRNPFSLSGGEKRRVAIAGVLAMEPDVLILDEPTAGLDPAGVRQISGILEELHAQGTTIILITHDMELVAALTERAIVMEEGRIVIDGPVEEVFQQREALEELGMDRPAVVTCAERLRREGWEIGNWVMTVEELVEEVLKGVGLCRT
ncbi:MAG: energy-coupling factor transporter ATPase [Candidatus Latescibacteria bacterium]|nr:energy-coupling factor transporter ATPase [Candidatus Latescibacterota bacterium]